MQTYNRLAVVITRLIATRMKSIFFVVIMMLSSQFALAEGPLVQWTKTFGGTGYDDGYSVQQTSDGGYIIAGTTRSYGAGSDDVYLVKTNGSGSVQWTKTFGGTGYDDGHSVQQTSDGGYIITGTSDAGFDLIKTNSSGSVQWTKNLVGRWGTFVQQTSDGGYIILRCYYDIYLVKTNSSGTVQWTKTFGGGAYESSSSVQQTSDGGYIVLGTTRSYGAGEADVYLIKTNSSGSLQWEKTFGGTGMDTGDSVRQTSDGGYIISGTNGSNGAGTEVSLIKTNSSGSLQWEKTFGGTHYEIPNSSVRQTSDGGYIIAATTSSYGAGSYDVYLVKTNSFGTAEWTKTFGGTGYDGGYSVEQTSDGGYIATGSTQSYGAGSSDVYLIKLDKLGLNSIGLTATNNWDGKSIDLSWNDGFGVVDIWRDGVKIRDDYGKNSYTDKGLDPNTVYIYRLKDSSGSQWLTDEIDVKTEVIVVLVRGYSPTVQKAVDSDYWKADGHSGLVDVKEWFAGSNVTCWEPPQGYLSGNGLSGWKSIAKNADELKDFIDEKRTGIYSNAKISLIGHSMGGLIARKYTHDNPNVVDNIFSIQTPHTGSPLADLKGFWDIVSANIGSIIFNDATSNLKSSFLGTFNNENSDLKNTNLYSFWSTNYKDVLESKNLKRGYYAILPSIRWTSNDTVSKNDGAVPKLSAQGFIWGGAGYLDKKRQVYIPYQSDSSLDHFSCYRHPNTLETIMGYLGLTYTQSASQSMGIALAAAEESEPSIAPQYYVAGFTGEFDNTSDVNETVSIGYSNSAYFRAITSDASCSFWLTDPCGTTYDQAYASSEPNVNYSIEDEIFAYEVNSPIPGNWTLNLSTIAALPATVSYGLTAFESENIALYSYTNPSWANADANILIVAGLTENDNPLTDANIVANIVLSDVNSWSLTLYDDGLHNDANADDGFYANTFNITAEVGTYNGQITATGLSGLGTNFERNSSLSFTVSSPDVFFEGDINDVGIDLNANGLYDTLRFTIPVDVCEPNDYLLTATLSDSNDVLIKLLSTGSLNLPEGSNSLILEVTAEDMVTHDVNGPYILSDITISDANTGLTIAEASDHNTVAYAVSDFEQLDTDDDGLSDNFELSIGTDINEPDSDFDGVSDYNEVGYDGNANTYNPATDLNPFSIDTDGDGMSDGWEIYWSLNPIVDDGAKDNDIEPDGLTNLQEYQNNTKPDTVDTDSDTMPDGWEVDNGLNPVFYDGMEDADTDDLVNAQEYQNGTDPNDADTDDDGLTDGNEVNVYGTVPTDSDTDDDSILDGPDNCKLIYNPEQKDVDSDGIGDTCEADITGDHKIDIEDLARLTQNWLSVSCGDCDGADLDGQEDVDMVDFAIFAEYWLVGVEP